MTTQKNRITPATHDDVNQIVPLISESPGGVWPAIWKALANNGEAVENSAVRYLVDDSNNLSTKNTVVIKHLNTIIAVMITYRESRLQCVEDNSDGNTLLPKELTSALVPYQELCDPDSLFTAELCCLPQSRGRGIGSQLLDHAKQLVRTQGLPRITLRVFSENTGAVRLYQRSGYEVVDQRLVVPHPEVTVGGSVFLMSYSL